MVRPPARDALYHRFENELFDELLVRLSSRPEVKIILLARTEAQRETFQRQAGGNMILPRAALDGSNLIAASDLVISAGGTINREAAALGVPAVSIYAGKWAAVDEELLKEGRLRRVSNADDLRELLVQKKQTAKPRRSVAVIDEVVAHILEK